MYLKKHTSERTEILALCDEEILGKTFRENGLKLEINERFYKGEKVDAASALKALETAKNANLAGKEVIQLALNAGIIEKETVLMIQEVPYALLFQL